MSGIEISGTDVTRPVQDHYKMKKKLKQQADEIALFEKQRAHFNAALADAKKTIEDLEKKIFTLEERLTKRISPVKP